MPDSVADYKGSFNWTHAAAPRRIITVLNDIAGPSRFVGGCVRDSLLGMPPGEPGRTDIDIATAATPDRVIEALDAAGIRSIPTGIDHGTVTAVIDGIPFEVTTLRADVETDGRRATVRFTEDFRTDALRRDFTINALYLDADGIIHDPVHGLADLAAHRVRFIGRPDARITEDYLRILRFLRFSSRFADHLDEEGMAACEARVSGLQQLSKERIWHELSRTFGTRMAPLVLDSATPVILSAIIDVSPAPQCFAAVHGQAAGDPGAPLSLAALFPKASVMIFRDAFRPPNAVLEGITALRAAAEAASAGAPPGLLLYRWGEQTSIDGVRLAAAQGYIQAADDLLGDLLDTVTPVLPVRGADFVAAGVPKGPKVGAAMALFEEAWIEAGFPVDPDSVSDLTAHAVAAISA